MGYIIDTARMFTVKQRIRELEKAIERWPDNAQRASELRLLQEELREFQEGYK